MKGKVEAVLFPIEKRRNSAGWGELSGPASWYHDSVIYWGRDYIRDQFVRRVAQMTPIPFKRELIYPVVKKVADWQIIIEIHFKECPRLKRTMCPESHPLLEGSLSPMTDWCQGVLAQPLTWIWNYALQLVESTEASPDCLAAQLLSFVLPLPPKLPMLTGPINIFLSNSVPYFSLVLYVLWLK